MIKLESKLSRNSKVKLQDVYQVKRRLASKGYYKIPEYGLTPYPDEELFIAIKQFQKDSGLKSDGVIAPGGKTLQALNSQTDEVPMVRSPTIWCPKCGAPHGGSQGDLCPDCTSK